MKAKKIPPKGIGGWSELSLFSFELWVGFVDDEQSALAAD